MKHILLLVLVLTTISSSCNKEEMKQYDFKSLNMAKTTFGSVEVNTWMYQIQSLDEKKAIDVLDDTDYDMLVVEPGHNFVDFRYDVSYLVDNLKSKPDGSPRVLFAYIDIGQAEDYRDYWANDWLAPSSTNTGFPDFLLTIDPDGWSGNYPVAYWDLRWQELWLGSGGIIEQIADYGFDGVYLDWVEAYDDDKVREAAQKKGLNPEYEMLLFIERIKHVSKSINPSFYIIAQNAPYLIDEDPVLYKSVIDAIATEDTWFYGEGDAEWNDKNAGDLKGGKRQSGDYSTTNRIAQNKKYLMNGIPVFTIDYCREENNAEMVYYESWKNGFIPIVTRVSLSELTKTPPFNYID